MSPVAICGMPKWARSTFACVPLPEPGAPYRRRFNRTAPPAASPPPPHCVGRTTSPSSLDEASVLAHDQLRLQLLHGVERDAHDDQDRGAAEVHLLVRDARDLRRADRQDHRDEAEEDRADERDAIHHGLQVIRGWPPWTY